MSVDVVAELARPVALVSVLRCAADALKALLGLDSAPGLEVIGGRRTQEHLRVSSGRPLSTEDLATTMIGYRISPAEGRTAESRGFEVELVGAKDRAFVTVIDLSDVQGVDPRIEAVVSPTRTCVGVVLATAVALGAAVAGGGEFVDMEIVFMWQFPQLDGWPRDRSTRRAGPGRGHD